NQVYRITGASESVVADSNRKNRIYAVLIGVRIASLFVVLLLDGWMQIIVFVGGMLAPWIGVQIANNIRQVQNRSIEMVAPQQAALETVKDVAEQPEDTVLTGDFIIEDPGDRSATPSAKRHADHGDLGEDEKHNDTSRS